MLKADIIRAAVEESIKIYAATKGLDIETAAPHVNDIEIQSVDHPSIKAIMASPTITGRSCPFRVEVMNNRGEIVRRLHVTAHVRVFASAVVLTRDIARGDSIGIDDMTVKRMEVGGIRGYYSDPGNLAGARAKASIRSGTILRKSIILANPVIRKGDRVTVKVISGSVEVTSQGIARADGGTGDTIRVYNEMTRTTVFCTVIDSRTVRLGKGG